ncbi:uncharacterized protein LOC106381706 isoform X1 [Brassica napus]|uniref:uncharacterized protein LOC106381706 isoform X1 n=3 Tax=Brassica napus TaxID=3708 RepID=UPI002078775A|nr:uncharacterized protein LOC106381706 isoform X1 [Brassica napus]
MSYNADDIIADVAGEIHSVQGLISGTMQQIVVRLLIEPDVTVYLSLWDEATSTFSGLLKRGDKSQSVMLVVTTVNPKLFGGNLYLTSTPGDMFVFDTSLSEITKFVSRLKTVERKISQAALKS